MTQVKTSGDESHGQLHAGRDERGGLRLCDLPPPNPQLQPTPGRNVTQTQAEGPEKMLFRTRNVKVLKGEISWEPSQPRGVQRDRKTRCHRGAGTGFLGQKKRTSGKTKDVWIMHGLERMVVCPYWSVNCNNSTGAQIRCDWHGEEKMDNRPQRFTG